MSEIKYDLQEVGQYGEPGRTIAFSSSQITEGLAWIAARFADKARRVHVWRQGGRRLATLKAPTGLVQRFDDLLQYDSVSTPEKRTVRPVFAREPYAAAKESRRTSIAAPVTKAYVPDVADMITDAVAELNA